MTKRKKALIWLLILAGFISFLIWHTVKWQTKGMHARIFNSIKAGKSYIAVIYNLGLAAAMGISLGLFMEKLTEAIGYEVKEIKHFEDESNHRGHRDKKITFRRRKARKEKQMFYFLVFSLSASICGYYFRFFRAFVYSVFQ